MHTTTRIFLAGLLAAASAACSGMKTYLADSRPLDRQISIDGRADDWVGRLNVIPDARLEVGFLNDERNLCVIFVTEDKALKEAIIKGGLTIWFDPNGKEKKTLGIKYPLGMGKAQKPGRLEGAPDGPQPDRPEPDEGRQSQARPGAGTPPGASLSGLEIITGDGKAENSRRGWKLDDLKGIELATSPEGGLFVYELMIPLRAGTDRPFAVGADSGATIGIGFEVPKSALGPMGNRPPGGEGMIGGAGAVPGAGMPGGGMIPGSGIMGGGRQGGGEPQMEDPDAAGGLKMWTYVKLSAGKVPAAAPGVVR
ncbi:MAG: hypothetical protein ABFD80_08470 [Acidobacteriota bacterium]